ncbi:MAG: hypothetical protein IJ419_01325 [Agathobacter sp.]|nr:hypothetical protein [Agathobacter sp.]
MAHMIYLNPVVLRRAMIIKRLKKANAISEDTAKTLEEVGVKNPTKMPKVTAVMVKQNVLGMTEDGRYWLKPKKEK